MGGENVFTEFLTNYIREQQIPVFLGFQFLLSFVSMGLFAALFESKKRPVWMGIAVGAGVIPIMGFISLFINPYFNLNQSGIWNNQVVTTSLIGAAIGIMPIATLLYFILPDSRESKFKRGIGDYEPYGAQMMSNPASKVQSATVSSGYESRSSVVDIERMESILHSNGMRSRPDKNSIFISYRRHDSMEVVGRIYDHLVREFGEEAIFMDVDSIPFGVDFRKFLREVVGQCGVLLAIVGDRWLDAVDDDGNLRLMSEDDYVRIEIASALQRDVPVVPVLIRGQKMPSKEKLPEDLQDFVYRNATSIRNDPDFRNDMERLIEGLRLHLKI